MLHHRGVTTGSSHVLSRGSSALSGIAGKRLCLAKPVAHRLRCRSQNEEATGGVSSSQAGISYPLVAALATLGAAETAYLTVVKLFDAPLVCPTSGCEDILQSDYSSLFGVPLSLLGMLAYGAVAAVAFLASRSSTSSSGEVQAPSTSTGSTEDSSTSGSTGSSTVSGMMDSALLSGVVVLATCSSALMYIIQTDFGGEACAWCYLSAGLSFSLLLAVAGGMGVRRLKSAAAPGAGALVSTVAALYFGFGSVGSSASQISEIPYYTSDITTQSSQQALQLVQKLQQGGAKMYGAFWCSHCYDQKQTFGKDALPAFPYVECFPDGWKRGAPLAPACDAAGVRAFPTWVINGRIVEGEQTLEQLQVQLDTPAGESVPEAP